MKKTFFLFFFLLFILPTETKKSYYARHKSIITSTNGGILLGSGTGVLFEEQKATSCGYNIIAFNFGAETKRTYHKAIYDFASMEATLKNGVFINDYWNSYVSLSRYTTKEVVVNKNNYGFGVEKEINFSNSENKWFKMCFFADIKSDFSKIHVFSIVVLAEFHSIL